MMCPTAPQLQQLERRLHLSATMVKDINTTNSFDLEPLHRLDVNGTLFFTARDNVHGLELWKLDPADDQIKLVADLMPGPASSDPANFHALDGDLYFFALAPGKGRVLMRSDGTSAGTAIVKDVSAAKTDHVQFVSHVAGDRLFFSAINTRNNTFTAVVSDGTAAGTRSIIKGANSDNAWQFDNATSLGDLLFFSLGRNGRPLIVTDGTAANTRTLEIPDLFRLTDLQTLGDHVLAAGRDHDGDFRLWRIDDDLNVELVKTFDAELQPYYNDYGRIDNMRALDDDTLVFSLILPNANELWATDGTASGTVRITERGPLPHDLDGTTAVWNGRLFYRPADGGGLWLTDGARTFQVAYHTTIGQINHIATIGDALYVIADNGNSIWTSGVTNPTQELLDLPPFIAWSAFPPGATRPVLFGKDQPWVVDPSSASITPIPNPVIGTLDSDPTFATSIGDTIYFTADNAVWRTTFDGRDATLVHRFERPITNLLSLGDRLFVQTRSNCCKRGAGRRYTLWSLDPATGHTLAIDANNQANFHVVDDVLYFTSAHFAGGVTLTGTDGTLQGTADPIDLGYVNDFRVVGDRIFFTATQHLDGDVELWVTDHTPEGTRRVKDIRPGPEGSYPYIAGVVGDDLLFTANDGSGRELWQTDGTSKGTVRVDPLVRGVEEPQDLRGQSALGKFFFTFSYYRRNNSSTAPVNAEPWVSDGTPKGTFRLKDINPGRPGSNPRAFTELNGFVYFLANAAGDRLELWRSDGTRDGTKRVKRLGPTDPQSSRAHMFSINGSLLLNFKRGNRHQLWTSDGTTSGTRPLPPDLRHLQDFPQQFHVLPDRVLFVADDGRHGHELWQSDGTPEGTKRLTDLIEGPPDSVSHVLGIFNDKVLIAATDGAHGREPWLITLDD